MRLLKNLFFISIIFIFLFFSIVFWNRSQIEPTKQEISILKEQFGDINIRSESDIFRISKQVVDQILHKENFDFPLSVSSTLKKWSGFCYDRSLILQKIFIYNDIPIRPVFVYYSTNGNDVSVFNLFDKNLNSHNVFEYNLNGNWYLMRTNAAMSTRLTLSEYLDQGLAVPKNSKYIRFLNNRSGRFIYPSYIPDIYFF